MGNSSLVDRERWVTNLISQTTYDFIKNTQKVLLKWLGYISLKLLTNGCG